MYREKCGDNMKKKKDPSFMEGSRITGKNNNDEKKNTIDLKEKADTPKEKKGYERNKTEKKVHTVFQWQVFFFFASMIE